MTSLTRWWVIFCSLIAGFFFAGITGGLTFVWEADHSKLSVLTIGLFWLMTVFVGYLTKKITTDGDTSYEKYLPACWYASDVMIALGMLGTLIGFILMFQGNIAGLDPSNTDSVKQVIAAMSNGFSVGVITTVCGLIASVLLRLQLTNLELKD